MKAAAYFHGPARILANAQAFAAGCEAHGVECPVVEIKPGMEPIPGVEVVWMWGMGPARPVFDAYDGLAMRLVADRGYWHEYMPAKTYMRMSIDAQQPDLHLKRREHPLERFEALKIDAKPQTRRGQFVLLCGMGLKQAEILQGLRYGQWERRTFETLRNATKRPIVLRAKPKCPPIAGVPNAPRGTLDELMRQAWAVVCFTGNVGADAVLANVPVVAQAGPGRVYGTNDYSQIDRLRPLDPDARLAALADIAHWQWTADELRRGEFWEHLRAERLVP